MQCCPKGFGPDRVWHGVQMMLVILKPDVITPPPFAPYISDLIDLILAFLYVVVFVSVSLLVW
jgi:hypothetical protein